MLHRSRAAARNGGSGRQPGSRTLPPLSHPQMIITCAACRPSTVQTGPSGTSSVSMASRWDVQHYLDAGVLGRVPLDDGPAVLVAAGVAGVVVQVSSWRVFSLAALRCRPSPAPRHTYSGSCRWYGASPGESTQPRRKAVVLSGVVRTMRICGSGLSFRRQRAVGPAFCCDVRAAVCRVLFLMLPAPQATYFSPLPCG